MIKKFYRSLYKIRRVEEEIVKVYPLDKIKSPVHLSIGQEAVSVGVCEALRSDDVVFGTYRSHAYYLAKGGDLKKMIAELYGKATGTAKGKGGSMHLIDVSHGAMGASAVVGTTIANAVGYAYGIKYQEKNFLVVSFFGDGAVDEGVFHESLNFASLKELPIIFICENNSYAIYTHQLKRHANPNIWERVRGYGIKSKRIESGDPFEIYREVKKAVKAIRTKKTGPYFFECLTYRWMDHVGIGEDFHLGYRTKLEREPWVKNDAVKKIASLLNFKDRQKIEQEVEEEIIEAFQFAEASPFPKDSQLHKEVFKN